MKQISIKTNDTVIEGWGESLEILNEFRMRFKSVSAFIQVVIDHNDKYKDFRKHERLRTFWNMRARGDQELNNDLRNVLEDLNNE